MKNRPIAITGIVFVGLFPDRIPVHGIETLNKLICASRSLVQEYRREPTRLDGARTVTIFPTGGRPLEDREARSADSRSAPPFRTSSWPESRGSRSSPWEPRLKRMEHADFFTRAYGILTTVFNPQLKSLRAPTPFDAAYMRTRMDLEEASRFLAER